MAVVQIWISRSSFILSFLFIGAVEWLICFSVLIHSYVDEFAENDLYLSPSICPFIGRVLLIFLFVMFEILATHETFKMYRLSLVARHQYKSLPAFWFSAKRGDQTTAFVLVQVKCQTWRKPVAYHVVNWIVTSNSLGKK